jgi:hypothetical protein
MLKGNKEIQDAVSDDKVLSINPHIIIASAGLGGSIAPFGVVTVDYGENQTFNITPNRGYRIANVLVDGTSVGAVSTYTFTNVTTDHSRGTDLGDNAAEAGHYSGK